MPSNKETPDLFEGTTASRSRPSPALPKQRRFVLPSDLKAAVKTLDDDQFDTLFKMVTSEAKRRGGPPPKKQIRSVAKKKPKGEPVQIPAGKANLIRAAIKAGCQRRSKIRPPWRSKTSPLGVMRHAILRVVPVVHVWTALLWQGLFDVLRYWSVRPCVRPVNAAQLSRWP
jgi:hypothetical protein